MEWISVNKKLPAIGVEVIGYSRKWIHSDFNSNGIRICFLGIDDEWSSAKWDNDQDSWHTHAKWRCENPEKDDFTPTHWQNLPKPPKP